MDSIFEALADPTRRLVLDELAERKEQTFYELCARLALKHQVAVSRQAIMKHLKVLEKANLIAVRRQGKYKVIAFNDEPLKQLGHRWLKDDKGGI